MSRVRRRVLRNQQPITATEARRLDRIQKKREQLDKERVALGRWMTKLKRAFHTMEKLQGRIGRLERDIARHDRG